MAALTLEHIRSTFAQPASRQTLHIEGYQKAAVLVPLCTDPGLELLFTKRTETVETHKGQISFPGGVVDETDSEIVETALREADEEVGLHRSIIMKWLKCFGFLFRFSWTKRMDGRKRDGYSGQTVRSGSLNSKDTPSGERRQ